jgi:amino acid permease
MNLNECPNCGYIMNNSDSCCKYCGTANPLFVRTSKTVKNMNPFIKTDTQNENNNTEHDKKKAKSFRLVSFGILFFLIIFVYNIFDINNVAFNICIPFIVVILIKMIFFKKKN